MFYVIFFRFGFGFVFFFAFTLTGSCETKWNLQGETHNKQAKLKLAAVVSTCDTHSVD